MSNPQIPAVNTQITAMAQRLSLDPVEMQNIVVNTIMPANSRVSNDQFVTFLAVANEYKLNPLTKEIYAFPAKGGGIQPIVSIDGWLKIINTQPDFDGMEHEDIRENGELIAIKVSVYKKGTSRPVSVIEYMDECRGVSEPWKRWPARMLRHKATIQAGRYAFGLSGIIDPDEAERFEKAGAIKKPAIEEAEVVELPLYTEEQFQENFPKWTAVIESGKKTPQQVVNAVESKYTLTAAMKNSILAIQINQEPTE